MAEIVNLPGGDGPVNDGERRVLGHLAETLPGNFSLHPNLLIPVGGADMVECDVVVIGPDCVWIVETKDLSGSVVVEPNEFVVNGEVRRHPVAQTRLKAQKIAARLRADPILQAVWVQPLVVLARQPAQLSIAPAMANFIMRAERAAEVIGDPTLVGLQRNRLSPAEAERVRQRLSLDARRRDARPVYGPYRGQELLSQGKDRQWWLASQELMGQSVLLEVVQISPMWEPVEQQRRRNEAIRAARVRARVGNVPWLLTPETAFVADDGSVVVVHPNDPSASLEDRAVEFQAAADDFKRKIVNRIAGAVDHCHSRQVVHRTIGPSCIFVQPNGFAKLGGFSRAAFVGVKGMTVSPADWGALGVDFWMSPEHLGGAVGPESDLFALGRLIEFLWPTGAPGELADAARRLTQTNPDDRSMTAKQLAQLAAPAAPIAAAPPPAPSFEPGATIDNRYRIVNQLGFGASGTVWHAIDELANRDVALKVYDGIDAGDAVVREYQALLDVHHPNIVKVRGASSVGGHWVLISEYLPGPNLRAAMPPITDVQQVDQAVSVVIRLLEALGSIHPNVDRIMQLANVDGRSEAEEAELLRLRGSGLVHRDVKPENVILVAADRPVLIDFGLAASGTVGAVGGTAAYRPPGTALDAIDPDLDLFAVGVILHELLTGRHPYSDGDPLMGELNVEEGLSDDLRAVLSRACSPRFEERFRTAGQFTEALVALGVRSVPVAMPPVDGVELMERIRTAMFDRRWDDATSLCPDHWTAVRDRIKLLRGLADKGVDAPPLLVIDGFQISHLENRRFESANDPGGVECGPGLVRVHLVKGPAGEMLEVLDHSADDGARWVEVGQTFQTPLPLSRLGQGLRIGTQHVEGGLMVEMRQARLKDGSWSNVFLADEAQLDHGAGASVAQVLADFGVAAFGTRESIIGDTGKRRRYMCAVMASDNDHSLAVIHFLTRVMPLARGVQA